MNTRSQSFSQNAFAAVSARQSQTPEERKKYLSSARSFPTLIHNCGLAQAVAYANAKKQHHAEVLADVATTMGLNEVDLQQKSREDKVLEYLRLTRNALQAASWVKRYAEALLESRENTDAQGSAEPIAS